MGLNSLVEKTPGRSDPALVSIEVAGDTLEFRRPTTADLQPTREQLALVSRSVPGMRAGDVFLAYLLGECYQPAPGEGKINPSQMFAQVAVKKDLVFSELCREWDKAFPEFISFISARAEAKNDSRAAVEASGTESPTSPPVLDESPVS